MLDPADAAAFRTFAHRLLDDTLDGFGALSGGPAWQPIPPEVKAKLAQAVPRAPQSLETVYAEFATLIAPYENGNRHARFLGWVHGAGTPSGMLAELLAAALNANTGGREHSAIYVERAVLAWSAEIFGFPPATSGILTSGTSLANLIAVQVARTAFCGTAVRTAGLAGRRLVGYASTAVHRSVPAAFDGAGLGSAALRRVPTDTVQRVDLARLRSAIAADRATGAEPFMVIATAGTVDTGAVDDLAAVAELCATERLWLHVDGAFGALAVLSPTHRGLLAGIERADSLAFDFHKWLHVPYDAGCVIFRDPNAQRAAFATPAAYLTPAARGTAAGEPWFAELGPELSRRFRALAIWFAFKEHGTQRLGAAIERNCRQAARLAARVEAAGDLKLAAPVGLNIVCFRFDDGSLDAAALDQRNAAIVVELQESGALVPSTTVINGRCVIRCNFTNHRIGDSEVDAIVDCVRAAAARLASRGADNG